MHQGVSSFNGCWVVPTSTACDPSPGKPKKIKKKKPSGANTHSLPRLCVLPRSAAKSQIAALYKVTEASSGACARSGEHASANARASDHDGFSMCCVFVCGRSQPGVCPTSAERASQPHVQRLRISTEPGSVVQQEHLACRCKWSRRAYAQQLPSRGWWPQFATALSQPSHT